MALTTEQEAVLDAYIAASQRLHGGLKVLASNYWNNMGSFRDADVARMTADMTSLSTAVNRTMSVTTEAYLTAMAAAVGESTLPGAAIDVSSKALRGIPDEELFRRPAVTLYGALARSEPFTKAKELGRQRLESLMMTNLQLSKTHTAQATMSRQKRVVGYRRVPRGYGACALCLVAATQRYHRGDLMPIHPGCQCGVSPVIGTEDPGLVLDKEQLAQVHDRMRETFGATASDARGFRTAEGELMSYRNAILVRNNSEIGPVLTVKKHSFYKPLDRN